MAKSSNLIIFIPILIPISLIRASLAFLRGLSHNTRKMVWKQYISEHPSIEPNFETYPLRLLLSTHPKAGVWSPAPPKDLNLEGSLWTVGSPTAQKLEFGRGCWQPRTSWEHNLIAASMILWLGANKATESGCCLGGSWSSLPWLGPEG